MLFCTHWYSGEVDSVLCERFGPSYTGSTPALGAGRPGSIPGIPTMVLSGSPGDWRGSEGNVDWVRLPAARLERLVAYNEQHTQRTTYNINNKQPTANNINNDCSHGFVLLFVVSRLLYVVGIWP